MLTRGHIFPRKITCPIIQTALKVLTTPDKQINFLFKKKIKEEIK